MGITLRQAGDYEGAIRCFREAIAIDSADYRTYDWMAYTYELLGDFASAETSYVEAIELQPHVASFHDELGTLRYRLARYEEAIGPFQRVTELKPYWTRGYVLLGVTYFQLDSMDDAKAAFEKSMEIGPTYTACANLGTIYFAEARYADAAAMYGAALDISDTQYRIWGNLGESYYWCPGERDKAFSNFEQAVELGEEALTEDPLDLTVISDLASYHGMLGNDPEARDLLDKAIALEPSDPLVLFRIAETYEELGEHELALDWMEAALDHGASPIKANRFPGLRRLRSDPRYQNLLDRPAQTGSEQG
jgi:tetratricopeptide (TPR) repeat protein